MTETGRIERQRRIQMIWILFIDALVIGAFAAGQGVDGALRAAVIMLAFTAFFFVGMKRSGTAEVVSGVGDERTRQLYLRSASFTSSVLVAVIVGWFLVTMVQGEPNQTLAILAMVYNVAMIGSAAYYSRRG